jgi:hypothetical protein
MLQAPVRSVPKEHPAVIHPMQYDLERACHHHRQQSAARQRFVAEAEWQSATTSTSAPLADAIISRVRSALVCGAHALALPRRQVAWQDN